MEYTRESQKDNNQANHDLRRRRINPLSLRQGSKAKMSSSRPLPTLLNFGLALLAACIIVTSCTVKSAEAKPTLKQYNTVEGRETISDDL